MKKKLLWCIGIVVTLVLIALGLFRYIEVQHRQTDPNWTLAEQIYNMENALKEVDKDYECKSISKVTPFLKSPALIIIILQCAIFIS